MNIFDFIKEIFFTTGKRKEIEIEDLQQFTPYMLNRWFSFYGKPQAVFVNETLNKYHTLFDDKESQYKFYKNISPRVYPRMIRYVKKRKEEKVKEEESITMKVIAANNNLSTREINIYVDLLNNKNN